MATPILDQLSIELSYKIFDPVSVASDDGQIFSSFLRTSYLNRAYNRLVRTLEIIHPNINEVISGYYDVADFDLSLPIPEDIEIIDLYYKANARGKLTKANRISSQEYLSVKAGRDSFYTPSINERFWTEIDKRIEVLPEDTSIYYGVQVITKQKSATASSDTGVDLVVPNNYYDLLLNMAAQEATADKGNWQIYQIYTNAINTELALISRLKTERGK